MIIFFLQVWYLRMGDGLALLYRLGYVIMKVDLTLMN